MRLVNQFTLRECEQYLQAKHYVLDRYQIVQLYMVLGGIPFYWDDVHPEWSAFQNIQEICFSGNGFLRSEYTNLFRALFSNDRKYQAIVEAWRISGSSTGAQVDLVIDRRDQIIMVCEMKFSINPFTIDKKYAGDLRMRLERFFVFCLTFKLNKTGHILLFRYQCGNMKLMILSLMMAAGMVEAQEPRELCNFSGDQVSWNWRIINDGVMGGLSRGKFRLTDEKTGVFEGELSLENNGGFSWVRTAKGDPDLSGAGGIRIRFRGDGRTYAVTLDTSGGYNAFSFNHYFTTEKDVWQTLDVPFAEFRAYWFGRKMPVMRIVNPANIRDVGFIIMDKKSGPFRLEIDSISVL